MYGEILLSPISTGLQYNCIKRIPGKIWSDRIPVFHNKRYHISARQMKGLPGQNKINQAILASNNILAISLPTDLNNSIERFSPYASITINNGSLPYLHERSITIN